MLSNLKNLFIVCTDCEGTFVAEDNARDTAEKFIPDGTRLFDRLNRYDDYATYVFPREHYNAGDTLCLLLPFLKAYGLTNQSYTDFVERKQIRLVEGALDANRALGGPGNRIRVVITTSYRPYAERIAREFGVSPGDLYATPFDLDSVSMTKAEGNETKRIANEINQLPELPAIDLQCLETHRTTSREVFSKLEHIIWDDLASKTSFASEFLSSVPAMGGRAKVAAVNHVLHRFGLRGAQLIYIGDSITDREVLEEVSNLGGLSICFNGTQNAICHSKYVCWGTNPIVAVLAAEIYIRLGLQALSDFTKDSTSTAELLRTRDFYNLSLKLPSEWGITAYDPNKLDIIVNKSQQYRVRTLGIAAAGLG